MQILPSPSLSHALSRVTDMEEPLTVLAIVVLAGLAGAALAALAASRWFAGPASADVVDTVVAVADQRLAATRGLIDGQLHALSAELGRVTAVVSHLESQRARDHGELAAQLRATADQTAHLTSTADALRVVLASPKSRGQWGERMAEDVLRLAGLVEGVSYHKQRAIAGGTIPDFTFLLPGGLVLHMDAKFPMANYARCVEAGTDHERDSYRSAFVKDVRARVKELTIRGYVDPPEGTVDYVLLFIPNESVYAFMHEQDPALLELALAHKVVLCSPLTLFALLAVIRQAVDAFALEQTSSEVLSTLGAFAAQWERFCQSLDKVGRAVEAVDRAYQELSGTRRRALERPLAQVEELRRNRRLPAAESPTASGTDGLRLVFEESAPAAAEG